jgi:acyl dehydratase
VGKEIVQRGLLYEELDTDVEYVHSPGRTISEADNTLFSLMTLNQQALHVDAVYSGGTEFGVRLVNSLFTLSVAVGASVNQLTQGTTIANLGFGRVDFPKPVFVGDTLLVRTTVLDKRLSRSRPDTGIVVFRHEARNQHGDVVAVAERTAMIKRTSEAS